ncbi:MAG: hypothetical protein ACI9K2_000634 [Myxococcota bacterium]|jgi:hypothetical protein
MGLERWVMWAEVHAMAPRPAPMAVNGRWESAMGLIEHTTSGRSCCLGQRVVVGRSRAAGLRIKSRAVSNEHAVIFWDGRWHVRDLGSRNGTWVGEDRLSAGAPRQLRAGDVLRFGEEAQSWVVTQAGGPSAMATRVDGGATVAAVDTLLCVPNPDDPLLTVFEGEDGEWRLEGQDRAGRAMDGQVVDVEGQAWVVHLPSGHEPTWTHHDGLAAFAELQVAFAVSRDEEHVEVRVQHGAVAHLLPARAHAYLLLTLARARLAHDDTSVQEQGWQDAVMLQGMLGLDRRALNVQVYRARKDFSKLGIPGGAKIIERRPGAGTLRIGVGALTIRQL